MNIAISQQVSATYARNHFKEVNLRAEKEGIIVIVNRSKPSLVMLSISEYKKLQQKIQALSKNN